MLLPREAEQYSWHLRIKLLKREMDIEGNVSFVSLALSFTDGTVSAMTKGRHHMNTAHTATIPVPVGTS